MLDFLKQIDTSLLLWINHHHSPFFDGVMFLVSGKWVWVPFYVVLAFFIIRKYKMRSFWVIVAAALLITMSDQGANLLKNAVQRPRPCKDPEIGYLVVIVNDYCRGAYGFVSNHAANSFALAGFISLMYRKKWITSGMMLWAAVISYSRIYLGVHYPGDIAAGALLGLMLAYIVYAILMKIGIFPVSVIIPDKTNQPVS
jgi:undecaprenyl-diphosphatase